MKKTASKIVSGILICAYLAQGMPSASASDLTDQGDLLVTQGEEEFLIMQEDDEISLESSIDIQNQLSSSSLIDSSSYGLTLTMSGLASYHGRIHGSSAVTKVYVVSVIQYYAYLSSSKYVSKVYFYRQQVTLIAYNARGN